MSSYCRAQPSWRTMAMVNDRWCGLNANLIRHDHSSTSSSPTSGALVSSAITSLITCALFFDAPNNNMSLMFAILVWAAISVAIAALAVAVSSVGGNAYAWLCFLLSFTTFLALSRLVSNLPSSFSKDPVLRNETSIP